MTLEYKLFYSGDVRRDHVASYSPDIDRL